MRTIQTLPVLALLTFASVAKADPGRTFLEYGSSVSFGGGVVQFVDAVTRGTAAEGPSWEGRIAFGTRKRLTLEAGYLGSLHAIDVLGLDAETNLLATNVEAVVRCNFASGWVQPYILGGAGWAYYNLTNFGTNASAMSESDHIAVLPIGLGIVVSEDNLMFDLRVVYRATSRVDMIAGPDASLDAWSATLRIGFEQ